MTVKHQYDPSIEMAEKVYPFNTSKKLYQAKNKAGAYEYVKASCGGNNILEQWDGKKENECWMIDNVEKEIVAKTTSFNTYSLCYVTSSAVAKFPGYMINSGLVQLICSPRGNNPFIGELNIKYSISEEGAVDNAVNSGLQHELVAKHFTRMNDKMDDYFNKMINTAKAEYGTDNVKTKLVGPIANCPKPSKYNGLTACSRYGVYQWIFINQNPW